MKNVLQRRLPGNSEPKFTYHNFNPSTSTFGFRTAGSDLIFLILSDLQEQCIHPWEQNKKTINKCCALLQHVILAMFPYIWLTKFSENIHSICVMVKQWRTCSWTSSGRWERKYKQKGMYHVTPGATLQKHSHRPWAQDEGRQRKRERRWETGRVKGRKGREGGRNF